MPGCAVKGCKNSSRQGVKMNRLPRNVTKRKKWIRNCEQFGGMKNWSPLDTAALCEYHFTADKWEKPRIDGKKKLKFDAVPTIFGDLVYQAKERINQQIVADVGTERVIYAQTDSSTKEVHLLPFSNEIKCEAIEFIKCELPEPMNIDNCEQTQHPCNEENQQQNCSVEVHESSTPDEKSSNGFTEEETSFFKSENNFQSSDSNTNILEKYQKLQKLYHNSEKTRIAMEKRHTKIYKGLQTKIKNLERQIMNIKRSLKNLKN